MNNKNIQINMTLKTKYSTHRKRKFIRMSWNKYNLFNLRTFFKFNQWTKKKDLKLTYKKRLITKQRLRRYYGHLREKQFYKIYKMACGYRGRPTKNLLKFLETRLDSVLFRINFAPSIFASNQLINHGHILVNGKKVTKPGYFVKKGDIIQANYNSLNIIKSIALFSSKKRKLVQKYLCIPKYFMVNYRTLSAIVVNIPKIKQIPYVFKILRNPLKRLYGSL